ncbi:unnamed protein product [Notodromas monacha]|uniref:CUB domain-containing protein n=1 Tax=Notodromas monacha TaxID=399045 RepID=A0A7R9G937_9CRUS|nr:unnamed protein product [Notodromas monacha]CAG0912202.1 unnamed protein product [Notodromas monacha]
MHGKHFALTILLLPTLAALVLTEEPLADDHLVNNERQLLPNFQGLSWFRPNNFLANLIQRTTGEESEKPASSPVTALLAFPILSASMEPAFATLATNTTRLMDLARQSKAAMHAPTATLANLEPTFSATAPAFAVSANSKSEVMKSPNWPADYSPGQDTFYCLEAGIGRKVNLHLHWIDLETHCGAKCDFIKVYDGCVAHDENLIVLLHGDNSRSNEKSIVYNRVFFVAYNKSKKRVGDVVFDDNFETHIIRICKKGNQVESNIISSSCVLCDMKTSELNLKYSEKD